MCNIEKFLIVLLLFFYLSLPVFGESERYALVIGNFNYTSHPLKNPVYDEEDMTNALKEAGFEVTTLKNSTFQKMENSIKDFGRKLKKAGKNATGIFYYSGHGIQVKGQNYLLPVDKIIEGIDEVKYSAVNAEMVLSKMESAGNKINIIIIDACNFTANSYRIPTEAEWEYAARGGNKSKGYTCAGSNKLYEFGWFLWNSDIKTHPVGEKNPNEPGLYDMSGNIWEWCWDWCEDYGFSPVSDPKGPATGSICVIRGGGYGDYTDFCRVSYRGGKTPETAAILAFIRHRNHIWSILTC